MLNRTSSYNEHTHRHTCTHNSLSLARTQCLCVCVCVFVCLFQCVFVIVYFKLVLDYMLTLWLVAKTGRKKKQWKKCPRLSPFFLICSENKTKCCWKNAKGNVAKRRTKWVHHVAHRQSGEGTELGKVLHQNKKTKTEGKRCHPKTMMNIKNRWRVKINTQHVSLRENTEEKGRGKGIEAVWET